ncbi:MAG: hypothetical protein WBL20_16325 [Sphingobium sp.]|uniref:hypothetical protein n=1 Tax=Sphingobium sp. TaxID=1912891 RepID=UPI003BAFB99B
MAEIETWVEEVLFRGRPANGPGSELPPRLYVVMGVQREEASLIDPTQTEWKRQLTDPMTMTQARERFGYSPSGLVELINDQAFAEVERLTAQLAQQVQRADAAEAALTELSAEIEAIKARLAEIEEAKAGQTVAEGE